MAGPGDLESAARAARACSRPTLELGRPGGGTVGAAAHPIAVAPSGSVRDLGRVFHTIGTATQVAGASRPGMGSSAFRTTAPPIPVADIRAVRYPLLRPHSSL